MNKHLRAPALFVEPLENRVLFSVLTVAPIDVTAGSTSTKAVFTATLDTPAISPITLSYATVNGTALAGRDYRRTVGSLIIPIGGDSASFSVPILPGVTTQPNLTFKMRLKVTPGNSVSPTTTATIIENSIPPSVIVNDAQLNKPGNLSSSNANLVVTLSNPTVQPVFIAYRTQAVTAVAGTDFQGTSGTLEIKPRQTSGDIKIKIIGNHNFTADAVFNVPLTAISGATVPAGTFSRVIIREVNPNVNLVRPQLTISSPVAVRGENEVFDLSLSAPAQFPVTARFATVAVTANTSQFTSESGLFTIAAGQSSTQITVPTVQDTDVNVDTTFRLAVSSLANAQLATRDPMATILAFPSIIASGVNVEQNDTTPTVPAVFTITLNDPSPIPVSVTFNTADGTTDPTVTTPALADVDYAPTSGTVTFQPGQTRQTVTVPILANNPNPFNPAIFFINLSGAVNGIIANGTATGTILDEPTGTGLPALSIAAQEIQPFVVSNSQVIPEPFAVTLTAASTSTITVHYATSNGTGVNGVDYTGVSGTLTFLPGVTEQDFNVAVAGSSPVTVNRTFNVTLSDPTNATLMPTEIIASSTISELGVGVTAADDEADNLSNVSNGAARATVTTWLAGAFTVEDEATTIQSVNLLLNQGTGVDAAVALFSGTLAPTTFVAALNGPSSFSSTPAVATFTVPDALALEAGLQYWVVLKTTSGGAFQWSTTSDVTGTGAGFQPLSAVSSDSGITWISNTTSLLQFNVIMAPATILLG